MAVARVQEREEGRGQKLESSLRAVVFCLRDVPNSEVVNSVGEPSQFLPPFNPYLMTKGAEKDINCWTNILPPQ